MAVAGKCHALPSVRCHQYVCVFNSICHGRHNTVTHHLPNNQCALCADDIQTSTSDVGVNDHTSQHAVGQVPASIIQAFLEQQQTGTLYSQPVALASAASTTLDDTDDSPLPYRPASCLTPVEAGMILADAAADVHSKGSSQPVRSRRRLPTWLKHMINAAVSLGLVAGGVAVGAAMYKHYMAQLDDRDQLAKRVADLKRAEEKLISR